MKRENQFPTNHMNNTDVLYDITEVCAIFKTTSRTLRFYEEKGIIQSITPPGSTRRHYTQEQLDNIKNVLTLRTLDISIKSIRELQKNETDLKSLIQSRRAEIHASIERKISEIGLLNDALSMLETGQNIFQKMPSETQLSVELKNIITLCSNAIVSGATDILYNYLSEKMILYMPKSAFEAIRKDTLLPLGDFICTEEISVDTKPPIKIHHYIKFSKLGLKITYVFQNNLIEGLWLGYYELQNSASTLLID